MIAFAFTFPGGRYHATPWGRHANEADVAWPPEPVRILRALIATWWRKADHAQFPKPVLDDLIDALAAEPPLFRLPPAVHSHIRAFMPAPTDKTLIYDGFLRFDPAAELVAAWPSVTLTLEQEALAAHLLGRLGYLGRAESWVEGRVAPEWDGEVNACPRATAARQSSDAVPVDVTTPLTAAAWAILRDQLTTESATMAKAKRVATTATLPERLSDAVAVDTGDWQQAGWSHPPPLCKIVYDRPAIGPLPPPARRPADRGAGPPGMPEIARFVLAGRPCPPVEHSLKIGDILRRALMSRGDAPNAPTVPPVELSGRDDNGPLRADSGHAHAFFLPEDADRDGVIDHLLVYCRHGFSAEARRRLDRLVRLWIAHGRADDAGERGQREWRVALEGIAAPSAFAASPCLGASRTWRSATPYLKPRFDKRCPNGFDAVVASYRAQIIAEWTRRFPDCPPPLVDPITDPAHPNGFAAPLGPGGALRSPLAFARTRAGHGGRQPDTAGGFFRLTFAQDVTGPIALGWGAHFGLGLFRRDD